MAIWSIECSSPAASGWTFAPSPVGSCMSRSVLMRPEDERSPRLPGSIACISIPTDARSNERRRFGFSMYRTISGMAVVSYRWQSQSTTGTSRRPRRSTSRRAFARNEKSRSGTTVACRTSDTDIDLSLPHRDLVPLQRVAPVGGAPAGAQVVLPAVPRADEARLGVDEPLAGDRPVGVHHRLVAAQDLAGADRPALVAAAVLV